MKRTSHTATTSLLLFLALFGGDDRIGSFTDAAFYRSSHKRHYSRRLESRWQSNTALSASSLTFKTFDGMLESFRTEPVLIYFTSRSCGPCRIQNKELVAVTNTMGSNAVKVFTISTEKFPHVGVRYEIGKLPCLLLVKDKQVLLRLEGLTTAEDLQINLTDALDTHR